MAVILDGRAIAARIVNELKAEATKLTEQRGAMPLLRVVRVGDDPPSVRYARQITRAGQSVGAACLVDALPETTTDDELIARLRVLGSDPGVNGILLQFPLPAHLSRDRAAAAIAPGKDVDGVNPINAGLLYTGRGRFVAPATPLGGMELLRGYAIPVAGRRAVVVGRSDIVGRPMAMLLLRENATVTICHSRTTDLGTVTRQADILAVAIGKPGLITGSMVTPGSTVIDFGANVISTPDGATTLVGDVDFASVEPVAGAITPVPGGTGPMTNVMLLRNLIEVTRQQTSP